MGEESIGWLTIWVLCFILGVVAHFKRQKDFREGKIEGIPPSKNFFDWMFYNYRDGQ